MPRPDRCSSMARWLLLCLALAGCTVRPDASPQSSARPTGGAAPALDDLARRVHAETNAARTQAGLAAVDWSPRLARIAQGHSEDMARRGYFDHVSPDGVTPRQRGAAAGVSCRKPLSERQVRVGVLENLYQTTRYASVVEHRTGSMRTRTVEWLSPGDVARAAVTGWLESPGHRRNLLDIRADAQGIGVAVSPDSLVLVTQVLC